MHYFVPAEFDLYEFDDGGVPAGGGELAERRLVHWDGLIGEPAEEVQLRWSAGDRAVIVCTSGRSYDTAAARFRAAHLALGGDALPLPARPADPAATHRAMEDLARSPLWSGTPEAETAALDGFSLAHRRVPSGTVLVAAVNLSPDRLPTRPVHDWSPYDPDPRTAFPLGAICP
ncbi:hypothetical protein [Actinacidiphila alni]|uniref:hypothetical protein n=1 Tax=Actinacidiphila alni TaxID=380248 RepID=UPI003454D10E